MLAISIVNISYNEIKHTDTWIILHLLKKIKVSFYNILMVNSRDINDNIMNRFQ